MRLVHRILHSPAGHFVRHYLEMVVAMLLGMAALGAVEATVWDLSDDTAAELVEMAVWMTVPMVAWMRLKRHRWLPVVEMSVAMYAGFVVLFPLLWWGGLREMGLMMGGHVLMPLFMLGAMLARRKEYARAC